MQNATHPPREGVTTLPKVDLKLEPGDAAIRSMASRRPEYGTRRLHPWAQQQPVAAATTHL